MDPRSRDVLAALAEVCTDGLVTFGHDGRAAWASPAFCRLLRLDEAAVAGHDLRTLCGSALRDRWPLVLERLAEGHPGQENRELPLLRADGTRFWALVTWAPLPAGAAPGAYWARISEYATSHHLSKELRRRDRQLAASQDLAGLGSWSWTVGTRHLEWSPTMFTLLGYAPDEVEPTPALVRRLVDHDDLARVAQDLGGPLEPGARLTWQLRMRRCDGTRIVTRVLAEVVGVPDPTGAHGAVREVHGTVQDVTVAVRASEDAESARQRLLLLQGVAEEANRTAGLADALDAAWGVLRRHSTWRPSAIFVPDGTGVPDATSALDGTGEPDPPPIAPIPLHAQQPEAVVLPAPDATLALRCWRARETCTLPVPGHEATHTSLAVPVLLDGRTCTVVQLVVEESPVDETTLPLVTRLAELLGSVAQREHDAHRLAVARDQAERASRTKSDFLATMSHEIRTPLNGVIGLTELLQRTALDDRQRTLAEALRGTGHSLLSLVNDVLDLSKIESGRLELDRTDLDVRATLEQAVSVVAAHARTKGLELVTSVAPDVPEHAVGDPVRLAQVVSNLSANAVKFTDAGEVAVRVTLEPGDGLVLRVEVHDTGIGIDLEDHDGSLFDAFTQADTSSNRRHDGSGLGLAICQRLVTAMGGRIGVASAPGQGSTFWFTARLGRPDQGRAPRPRAREGHHALRGVRVLVVEDNATALHALVEHLRAWDLEPDTCTTSAEALGAARGAAATGRAYDLVLVDRSLPGDAAKLLADELAGEPADEPADGPGLVLLDGTASEPAAASTRYHATVTKPVRRDDLRQALLVALRRGAGTPRRHGDPEAGGDAGDVPGGVRVLLAEDNAVNQLVAVGLLESLGCAVDVAVDGEQALARLAADHPYHVVLMDCRMPHTDGIEATRRLRSREAADGRPRVPVLAMTASVLDGERERCLDAGMDDFLTKPVDRARLSGALSAWVRPARTPPADERPGPPEHHPEQHGLPGQVEQAITTDPELLYPDEDERPVLDFARVELLRELVKEGISFFDRTRESYLSRVDPVLAQLRAAVARADHDALLGLAHQLKGSSANLGLVRVAATAHLLEEAARSRRDDGLDGLLEQLGHHVAQARRALDSVGRTAASRPRHRS